MVYDLQPDSVMLAWQEPAGRYFRADPQKMLGTWWIQEKPSPANPRVGLCFSAPTALSTAVTCDIPMFLDADAFLWRHLLFTRRLPHDSL